MRKIANLIVDKRIPILILMLVLAFVSAMQIPNVVVNTDMSKYLPNDSAMRKGIDIMDEELPDSDIDQTIRVMFKGLAADEKTEMEKRLEDVKYVDSVDYEIDNEDYNKDDYTKYVINTKYDYNSDEELSIEKTLETQFAEHDMQYANDSTSDDNIPTWIFIFILVFLMIILFVMCSSWFEPVLFMVTIGIAVVINMGTNIFMGDISSITSSISSILQLVLSMDYSIILMNRYRQECEQEANHTIAMKSALVKAFSSIASSSMTTVVGLLTLAFMSLKIGRDLGFVLAKGVFVSVICILVILPGLILTFDKLVQKTAKKIPEIPTKGISCFCFKYRNVLLVVFVLLFGGAYILKDSVEYSYTMTKVDPVAEVFSKGMSTVVVYENKDEERISKLGEEIEKDDKVDTVVNYSTTLGKEYTARKLSKELEDIDDFDMDVEMDESLINMIYYYHYKDGKISAVTMSDFIDFITEDVMNHEAFSEQLDDNIKDQIDDMKRFASAKKLQEPMTIKEMADFFDMEREDCEKLFLFYYIKKGGIDTGTMTVPQFVDFILDDVAKDDDYSDQFDEDALEQMEEVRDFTDKAAVTKDMTYKEMAGKLDVDKEMAQMLYVYYFANEKKVKTTSMTLPQMVDFLQNNCLKNKTMSSAFDKETKTQINTLAAFTNKKGIQKKRNAKQLATAMGMKEEQVTQLFLLKLSEGQDIEAAIQQMAAAGMTEQMIQEKLAAEQEKMAKQAAAMKMSEKEFVDFVVSDVLSNKTYASQFDKETTQSIQMLQKIMDMTISGRKLSEKQAASVFGMKKSMVKLLYVYHDSSIKSNSWTMSLQTAIHYIVDNKDEFGEMLDSSMLEQLDTGKKLIDATVNGNVYTSSGMADLLGMDRSDMDMIYTLHIYKKNDISGWKISAENFIHFLTQNVLTDKEMAENLDADARKNLKTVEKIVDGVITGKKYTAKQTTALLSELSDDLNENLVELLYIYYFSTKNSDPEWTVSVMGLSDILNNEVLTDPRFDDIFEEKDRENIRDLKKDLIDTAEKMQGENYSLMIITTDYPVEGEETTRFFDDISKQFADKLDGRAYMVGDAAMSYEMAESFQSELNFMTILTAVSIFLVVAFTFRSISVPAMLVIVIQSAVYITVALMGIVGFDAYYMAFLVVQSILMGAAIDYGILFTNYYREKRRELERKEALIEAYHASIHTIQTSGLILVLATGILGLCVPGPTIAQICMTISMGALCAILLIMFILPALLTVFDRILISTTEEEKEETEKKILKLE